MATKAEDAPKAPPKKTFVKHLVAGGAAGLMESSICHPLDTIKTRMQNRGVGGSTTGPIATGASLPLSHVPTHPLTHPRTLRPSIATLRHPTHYSHPLLLTTRSSSPNARYSALTRDTGIRMVKQGGVTSLYKGLTAVQCGIVPKMAIRFSSFEQFKLMLADSEGNVSFAKTFLAGIMAGSLGTLLILCLHIGHGVLCSLSACLLSTC